MLFAQVEWFRLTDKVPCKILSDGILNFFLLFLRENKA